MKNLHKAITEYKSVKKNKGFNPILTYNFLSDKYYVFYFYSTQFIESRFNRSHEVIC
jgi:hypothetical protein